MCRTHLAILLSTTALAACVIKSEPDTTGSAAGTGPGATSGPSAGEAAPAASAGSAPEAHPAAAGVQDITDETGRVYHVSQGQPGDPAQIGCADGQREAFVDPSAFPRIAGCLGSWDGLASLRAPATGRACGDDLDACGAPADLCAPGWRVCGAGGRIADLTQVSADECERAGGGRFSAAISHCETQSGCTYDRRPNGDYDCFKSGWCSESVCCGGDCGQFGSCTDGVWPHKTHIAQGTDQGCGATSSRRAGGLLCCRD
jgi:hypothetical protein